MTQWIVNQSIYRFNRKFAMSSPVDNNKTVFEGTRVNKLKELLFDKRPREEKCNVVSSITGR